MAVCRFCGQEFGNKQAVRAHLKACAAYLGNSNRQPLLPKAAAALPSHGSEFTANDNQLPDFDPVSEMRRQVSTEKLRLTLREIRQAHGELDARENARRKAAAEQANRQAQARASAEREREAARIRAERAVEARQAADDAREQRRKARRDTIQRVKRQVMDTWWGGINLSPDVTARIMRAMEAELAPLPVDELPEEELAQIARGVRDRIHGEAIAARNAAAARQQQKQTLQEYGIEYAQSELRDVDGLDVFERWRVEGLIRSDLAGLRGDESRAEVKARVDTVLDEEGFEVADDYDTDEDGH